VPQAIAPMLSYEDVAGAAGVARPRRVTTFALVHGAWHGPWCWEHVQPELEARGHRVVAVDLPNEDPSLGSAGLRRSRDACAGRHRRRHRGRGSRSPSSLALPVRRLVFVCALLPQPGRSLREPAVESTYVFGRHDHAVDPAWARRAAREGLGVEPIELDAGHSPSLTCPRELADLLG
jgi:pimeloyl-ACP methyl ester carboxylesterase